MAQNHFGVGDHLVGWITSTATISSRGGSLGRGRLRDTRENEYDTPHSPHHHCRAVGGSIVRVRAIEFIFIVGWGIFWSYRLAAAFCYEEGPRFVDPRNSDSGGHHHCRDGLDSRGGLSTQWNQFESLALWRWSGVLRARPGVGDLGSNPYRSKLGDTDVRKDEPELVTSGPYHVVRHPIYSGILLAGVGTATALNWTWFLPMLLVGVYFTYSAVVEERHLRALFPDVYPAYERSTKMLVPFIY